MTDFYSTLTKRLTRGASRAVLSLLGYRSEPLREHLRNLYEQRPGTEGSFLADPVFEATFGWRPADVTMGQLAGRLLHPELVKALANPPTSLAADYAFPRKRRPYLHQMDAWRALIQATPPRSVLVSSGTGSGKTECFLIPILNDLAREAIEQGAPLTGVRALFLYPLNALIKSQKDRLAAWSEPFQGKIRWCLYNGETRNQSPPLHAQQWRSEVSGRDVLRANPPPILVTNATMLEYMLVRGVDRPILDQSQGRLRWVVIDEAHSYIGSQAAELTLLLRRVLHAFGCEAEQVHFVATSATLGDGEDARGQLQNFLADIAGVGAESVTVVSGQREIPILPEEMHRRNAPLPDFDRLRAQSNAERFESLGGNLRVRDLRGRLVEQPTRLSDLVGLAGEKDNDLGRQRTLALLDLCTGAVAADETPLLPLRGHLFQRGQAGVWACMNPGCDGRQGTALDSQTWPFGRIYLERQEHCTDCEYPVFELVQCVDCGQEVLSAVLHCEDGGDWLRPEASLRDVDEFQLDLDATDPDGETLLDDNGLSQEPAQGLKRLVVAAGTGDTSARVGKDNRLDAQAANAIRIDLKVPNHDGHVSCPTCGGEQRGYWPQFRPGRIGAPFLLQAAIPLLLEQVQPMRSRAGDLALPLEGRRLIAFTDSRQGTARIAARLQQEAERNYVRSLLYHRIATLSGRVDGQEMAEIRAKLAALEGQGGNSVFAGIIKDYREKLAQLENPKAANLSWHNAVNHLLSLGPFNQWVVSSLHDLTFGLTDRQIAELCLWREFLFRPKRQFSLEGLGLLRLDYPAVTSIAEVPVVLARRGVELGDWQDLLRVVLDIQVRGWMAVNIPRDMLRWIGYPGKPTVIVPPGQAAASRGERGWPTAQTIQGRRSRLVRLLAFALKLDPEEPSGCSEIEEAILALWSALQPLLTPTESGRRYLDVPARAEIAEVREAWFCPVTRRLLPVTFRGISPYLPEHPSEPLTRCRKVQMPKLPKPFWDGDQADAENWLMTDPIVSELRRDGAWTDINDRIAGFSHYFRAVEHSAQIDGTLLTRREGEFKEGKINLLSCSTTMEMGVDIGGLSAVAMNNVPPHPANFLQRAGRAGRRGETAALSFTLCKNTPQGEAVFRNPLWPFNNALALPQVALQSGRIVQRHINALALTDFLFNQTGDGPFRLTSGWFFERQDGEDRSSPSSRFRDWCRAPEVIGKQEAALQRLCRRSVLAGIPAERLLAQAGVALEIVEAQWREELDALLANLEVVRTREGKTKPERAIGFQLERLRKEYLLGELATRGFLPGYGFPTGVVALQTSTIETLNTMRDQREDNRAQSRGAPSRELTIAVRDYAPGTDTALDGRVYRSAGVSLNWHLPAGLNAGTEIQSLRWVWRCATCGGSGTRPIRPERCPQCDEPNPSKLTRLEYLQPAGFAVDIRWQPHNNISVQQYIPVRDPLISLEGAAWMSLPSPALGRYRYSANGHIFHRSDGLNGEGYALCLRCGRADSMGPNGERPPSLKDHKRLRGGRNDDTEIQCPGNAEPGVIKDGLRLGTVVHTDIFELQLREMDTERPIDAISAFSIAVVLRRALCRHIGIEEDEIGASASPTRGVAGEPAHSIFLFDNAVGGAGYVGQVVPNLPRLLMQARQLLDCRCDKSCQVCLLSHDTQHHVDLLDRIAARAVLNEHYLAALALPDNLCVFGPTTRLELEPLRTALRRELQHQAIDEVRIYLGGQAADWEPLAWPLREELMRWVSAGIIVRLIAPQALLDALSPAQADELAALSSVVEAKCHVADRSPIVSTESSSTGSLIAEAFGAGRAIRWAASDVGALAPRAVWGTGTDQTRLMTQSLPGPLKPVPAAWTELEPSQLRRPVAGLSEVRIFNELNGSAADFGKRAWLLVGQRDSALARRLGQAQSVTRITYTDRYLKSPLNILLLHRLLAALVEYQGGIVPDTHITIRTEFLTRVDTREPYLLFHDWRDAQIRLEVIRRLFSDIGIFQFQELAKPALPHARELLIEWSDGLPWTMRLDQGLGYWKLKRGEPGQFPFAQGVDRQLARLRNANIPIEGGGAHYPTYWYCGTEGAR